MATRQTAAAAARAAQQLAQGQAKELRQAYAEHPLAAAGQQTAINEEFAVAEQQTAINAEFVLAMQQLDSLCADKEKKAWEALKAAQENARLSKTLEAELAALSDRLQKAQQAQLQTDDELRALALENASNSAAIEALRAQNVPQNAAEAEKKLKQLSEQTQQLSAQYQADAGKVQQYEERQNSLSAALTERTRALQEAQDSKHKAQQKLAELLKKEGFESAGQAAEMRKTEQELGREGEIIAEAQQAVQKLTGQIKTLTDAIGEAKTQDEKALRLERGQLAEQRDAQEAKARLLHARRESNRQALAAIQKTDEQTGRLRRRAEQTELLYRTAAGTLKGTARVSLEQYVQTAYFEQAIEAANLRFYEMSGGQFELRRRQDEGALELDVLNNYTGRQKPVGSLSGGQSFMAALALALGFSDVVQSYAGGVEIDTLFIDEGFGSLDDDTLEKALETLNRLSGSGRLIGVVSHVAQLKERIDRQIIVHKTPKGSSLELRK